MRRARSVAVIVTVVVTLTVAACSAEPPTATGASAPSASSTPPNRELRAPAPSPSTDIQELASEAGPCDAVPRQERVEEGAIEQLGGWDLIIPTDRGPLPYANGTATTDGSGVPIAYTVATNDNFESVAARFCVDVMYLDIINSVRRSPEYLFTQTLYVGDTINLDAHTIFSVGDQNGAVHDNPFPEMVYPPQR